MRLEPPTGAPQRFSYDPDGKRIAKDTAGATVRYLYQRDNMLELLQERDGAGNLLVHYTGGAGAPQGDGLESLRRGEDSSFYHYDWLGSTQELTDAAQAVTDTYRYDAWGNELEATGSTVNPHTYVGRLRYYAMAGTGLYHLGYRELASALGRFLTLGPARHDANWYTYAGGTPASRTDATGLLPLPPQVDEKAYEVMERLVNRIPVDKLEAGWRAALPYIVGAGIAIEELIRRNWRRFCRVRPPGWKHCSFNSLSPEIAALAQFQYDCAKPPDPARWPQRYDPSVYSKPNLPNRLKWQPLAGQRCRPARIDAKTGSQLFICPVDYVPIAVLHDRGRAGIARADLRRLEQSVVHEPCCDLLSENWHYIRIHHSGGPPKSDWF